MIFSTFNLPRFKPAYFLPILILVFGSILFRPQTAHAACPTLDTSNGTATQSITITQAGTYTIWSRIKAPDSTNNSYYLEIDDAIICGTNVGDSASIPANTWTWVDYKDGTSSSKITANLSLGSHTVRMVGREPGVQLDRVLFLLNPCTPTGTGDNCAVAGDTTPPTVSLTAPAAGATVSGNTTLSATATDDTAVNKVDFIVDGAVVNTDTTAPYSYTWDSTTVANGTRSISAKAYDAASNNTSTNPINVTVNNIAPTPDLVVTAISWTPTSPAAGNSIIFSATIKNQGAVATPAGAVHSVQFSVDGTAVSLSNNSTASLAAGASRTQTANAPAAWNAVGGTHTVTAYVDNSGLISETNESNNTLATSISIANPDTTPPTVSITSPANNATVSGTASLTATASDNIGVSRVDFYNGATLLQSDTTAPYTYTLDTTAIPNGTYTLTAKAYDAAGNNATSSAINITVNNVVAPPPDTTAPSTSITSPAAGATVLSTVNVTASAADNVGITKVELYIDGALVGTDFAASYIFSWITTGYSNGTHTLYTKAYDAAGNSSVSSSTSVTVNNPPPPSPKAGDVNGDNNIDVFDASIMLFNWNKSGQTRAQGDLNGDGTVNVFDASIMLFNWGK